MPDALIKILCIDDDEFIRILLRDVFQVHGKGKYDFYCAENIEKAEKIMKENKPDIIFLDLMFRGGEFSGANENDSFLFLERVKSDPKMKNVKVVIFSGYPADELKEKALRLGAKKFLIKGDYPPSELAKAVEEIVSGK